MAQSKQFETMTFAPLMLIGVILIGAMSSMAHAAHHHHLDTSSPASTTRIIQFRDANFSIWNENVKYNCTAMTNPKGTEINENAFNIRNYLHVLKISIWLHNNLQVWNHCTTLQTWFWTSSWAKNRSQMVSEQCTCTALIVIICTKIWISRKLIWFLDKCGFNFHELWFCCDLLVLTVEKANGIYFLQIIEFGEIEEKFLKLLFSICIETTTIAFALKIFNGVEIYVKWKKINYQFGARPMSAPKRSKSHGCISETQLEIGKVHSSSLDARNREKNAKQLKMNRIIKYFDTGKRIKNLCQTKVTKVTPFETLYHTQIQSKCPQILQLATQSKT